MALLNPWRARASDYDHKKTVYDEESGNKKSVDVLEWPRSKIWKSVRYAWRTGARGMERGWLSRERVYK